MKKAVKRTLWIVAVMMVIPAMSGQETYYYGVNARTLDTSEDAVIRKEVNRKGEKSLPIRTERKEGEDWELGRQLLA